MTSMMDPLTPEVIATVVALVLSAHDGSRTCGECTDDGCPQLSWAIHEATKAQTEPPAVVRRENCALVRTRDGRAVGRLHLSPDDKVVARTPYAIVVCEDLDQFQRFWAEILDIEVE